MKQLTRFAIHAEERSFVLKLEDDTGQTLELEATPEQIDLIIDALDDLLADSDDAFELEDESGAVYQKPLG